VSGDNQSKNYDETSAMASFLEEHGVAEIDIIRDYA
jgi:vancomycin permeability regulator SanA